MNIVVGTFLSYRLTPLPRPRSVGYGSQATHGTDGAEEAEKGEEEAEERAKEEDVGPH